jgi:hypothetical protein
LHQKKSSCVDTTTANETATAAEMQWASEENVNGWIEQKRGGKKIT